MDNATLRNALNGILQEGIGMLVFFVMKDGTVRKANINEQASEPVLKDLKNNINNQIRLLDDKQYSIINLSVADERVKTLYIFDLKEQPLSFKAMKEVYENTENGEYWKERMFTKKDKVRDIDGIILLAGIQGGPYFISYAKHYAIQTYTTNDHWYVINPDNQISPLSGSMIKMDGHFDYFLVKVDNNPTFLIKNLNVIEKYDDIKTVVVNQSKKVVDKLKNFNLAGDLGPIKKRIDKDVSFARKFLGAVNSSGDVLKQKDEDIIKFVNGNDELKKDLKVDDKGKFDLSNEKAQSAFIALLNDDMLHSRLTNNDYHVLAKNKITKKKKK